MWSITSSVSACSEAEPSIFQPRNTFSASCPITVVSTGAVRSFTGAKCGYFTCSLFFHEPKYLSMIAITASGSKSPAIQIATLFGT